MLYLMTDIFLIPCPVILHNSRRKVLLILGHTHVGPKRQLVLYQV